MKIDLSREQDEEIWDGSIWDERVAKDKIDLSREQDYALWYGSIWDEYMEVRSESDGFGNYLKSVYGVEYTADGIIRGTSEDIAWLLLNI